MARRVRGLKFNMRGWNQVVEKVIDDEAVPRMERVADKANSYVESDGYKVSAQGLDPLRKRDYHATVITTNQEAMADNASHDRLVQNFHLAGGK